MKSLRGDDESRFVLMFTDLMSMQICDEPSQFAESERPRPQGSSPVEEYPETEKYSDSDKEVQRNTTHILSYVFASRFKVLQHHSIPYE